ncbi:hypothetical protein UlMin_043687 [Ulmus minor]
MVLGIRSKSRKSVAIQVDYLIYVQEIKPWPLSRSLKSVQSVLLQWENGDHGSGSFISTVGDGKLEFTESFRLAVTLCKEASRKGTTRETYQKNNLEFSLYEPRKDKAMKGQLLGTALVNLADYGIIKETVYVSTPVSFKKSSKSSEQPVLYVIIQPLSKDSSSSSPKSGLSKEVSREIDGTESVSEAMTEMNDEEVEIASFTDDDIDDDDVSSQSSRIVNSSGVETAVSSQTMKLCATKLPIGSETAKNDVERGSADPAVSFRDEPTSIESSPPVKTFNHPKESSSPSLSRGYSAILGNPATIGAPFPHVQQERSIPTLKKSVTHTIRSSSSLGYPNYPEKSDNKRVVVNSAKMPEYAHESTGENVVANISNKVASSSVYIQDSVNENTASYSDSQATKEDNKKTWRQNRNRQVKVTLADSLAGPSGNTEPQEYEQKDQVLKLKDSSSSSPKSGLSKEVLREIDGTESVSEAITEMKDEEVEIASFTDDNIDDDDVSSQSSRIVNSSGVETTVSSQTMKIGSETAKKDVERGSADPAVSFRDEPTSIESSPPIKTFNHPKESSSPSLSRGYSAILGNPATIGTPFPHVQQERSIPTMKKSVTHTVRSSSSLGYPNYPEKSNNKRVVVNSAKMPEYAHESTSENVVANISNKVASSSVYIQDGANENTASYSNSLATQEDNKKTWRQNRNRQVEVTLADSLAGPSGNTEPQEYEQKDQVLKLKEYSIDVKQSSRLSQDASRDDSSTLSSKDIGGPANIVNKEEHLNSFELPVDIAMNNRMLENAELIDKPNKGNITKGTNDGGMTKAAGAEKGIPKNFSDSKAELESEIEMLKEELQEAAAVEVALYSVVAEHGSSSNKIHAPARRLSRFYQHACKANSQAKKANAARAAISGFILVSKACGNDVPRLTFWLSNSIVLRAILSQTVGKQQLPAGQQVNYNGLVPPREKKNDNIESFDGWGDPLSFMIALEKFEAWIFSRIVESVWWQTMTPHMQPAAAKGSSLRKTYGRKHGLGDHDRGNFSIDLWKKAFKDACERLCPAQAVGHDCGCLPMLARLVMEQLVSRLDVAMFNAILRENGEEMPTDPVSDPISDSKVLPIQAGKSSFGAGAQLKNAIGSWSRWLTDLFGIDDNDAPEDKNELGDGKRLEPEISFKPFRLLNALSDLMMLPFEMVADKSIRKEVCPAFSGPLIKMVLYNFVPDEFCPNSIPEEVFEALDSEDDSGVDEETVTSVPCIADPTIYSPPSATSLTSIIGEVGNQTLNRSGSLLRKAYTSDDELDELDSPITSIIKDTTPTSIPKKKGDRPVIRYQLLREAWKDGE